MKRKRPLALLGLAAVVVVGLRYFPMLEAQRSVVRNSEQFTLYSLNPDRFGLSSNTSNTAFNGLVIIGQTEVTDAKLKAQLVDSLYGAIDKSGGFSAACHYARHGIRARKGRRTIEATICFECNNIRFIENGKSNLQAMASTPKKLFNEALVDAGVALSPK